MRDKMIQFCNERMELGSRHKGDFNPETDKRDLKTEMKEELADFVNYGLMLMQKLEKLGKM